MGLTTFIFLMFVIITIVIYFIVPKKLQWVILLISSLAFLFYDSLNLNTIFFTVIVLLAAYTSAILIDKYKDTKKAKTALIVGILVILGQLIFLKYTNLFSVTMNHIFSLFNIDYQFSMVYRHAPLGVSYYSLIMISYVVDVYRKLCKPQKNILKCALFMSYFPILNSGPFIKYSDMESKLYEKHKFSYDRLCSGLIRVLWGFFKVLVISQRLAYFVDTVYSNLVSFRGFYVIIAALFFTLQLYTNFSGSIDIIIGISEILDIKLPENFRMPFFSKTITELWRRWHITLGTWLKDYIFYPLLKSNFIQKLTKRLSKKFGKKAGKKISLYLAMLIMWIMIGAWHGGAYNFIISSGILQFIYMVFEDLLASPVAKINKKLGIDMSTFGYKLYQVIRTFILFSFSMIFFRAGTVSEGIHIIKSMFVFNPIILFDNYSLFIAGLDVFDFRLLILSLIILFSVELLQRKGSVREMLFKQNLVFRWLLIFSLLFSVIIFGCYGPGYDEATFIYRQF